MSQFVLYNSVRPVAAAGDPYWNDVILSLPMTSDFLDVTGKTVSVTGAVVSGGMGVFDGTNDYLNLASSSALTLGSANFTIEGFFRRGAGAVGGRTLVDYRNTTKDGIAVYASTSGTAGLTVYSQATPIGIGHVTPFSDSVLEHWAVVRDSGTIYGYVAGIMVCDGPDVRTYDATPTVFIGDNYVAPSQPLSGDLNHVRVTKNICRYPGGTTFTPPTGPFPTSL